MKKLLFTIAFAMVAFTGCEKAVDVDVPFESPKLVLNGFMNPDSSFSVHVSKSQFVLDEAELKNIPDATVRIYEGDRLLGEMVHQADGFYKLTDIFPESGKTYTIQGEKAGFAAVNAKEKVLSPVTLSDLKSDTIRMGEYGEIKVGHEFTLHDPADEKNYYLIGLMEKGLRKNYYGPYNGTDEPEWEWQPYSHQLRTDSADPLLEDFCVGYSGCGLLLTDDFIDGKTHRLKLISTTFNYQPDEEYQKDVSFVMTVYQIPESYYRYFKTLEQNENVRDNPFAEPAKVYSNIEGGYGIWSSLTLSMIEIGE